MLFLNCSWKNVFKIRIKKCQNVLRHFSVITRDQAEAWCCSLRSQTDTLKISSVFIFVEASPFFLNTDSILLRFFSHSKITYWCHFLTGLSGIESTRICFYLKIYILITLISDNKASCLQWYQFFYHRGKTFKISDKQMQTKFWRFHVQFSFTN